MNIEQIAQEVAQEIYGTQATNQEAEFIRRFLSKLAEQPVDFPVILDEERAKYVRREVRYEKTIESLRRELENERARDIHSCGPNCTRSGCVNRRLREELAAIQAREQQLREALNHHHEIGLGRGRDKSHSLSQLIISGYRHGPLCRITDEALALPQDTSALEAMIAKAGKVMRERCASEFNQPHVEYFGDSIQFAIRAIPAVTIDDLK